MLCKTVSAFVKGIEAMPIQIETDVSHGMPAYHVVGQPDISIKESSERLRLALKHAGYLYPKGRITVNMTPALIRKSGSHFDLAIAMGILSATEQVCSKDISKYGFLGELSLDGTVNGTKGILPMAAAMKGAGIDRVVVPKTNEKEAMLIPEMEIYAISHLDEIVNHLNGISFLTAVKGGSIDYPPTVLDNKKDFFDVHGQEAAKRAIMVAAAGGHGLLMMGSPSTGKTMLAERIPTIMPEMSDEEIMETTMVYSVAGMLNEKNPIIVRRPFRQPHHKLTLAGLLGGGSYPKPGEITLADKGVLFLDEVGEFDHRLMDGLRLPMEKKEITLVRHSGQYTFPADFLLVGASNPCPCGYLGDPQNPCKCSASEILRYQRKFSGPIMDRIDIHLHLMPVAYEDLKAETSTSSGEMKEKILRARNLQKERYGGLKISFNHQLDERNIEEFVPLGAEEENLLALAYEKMKLNPRTLLKVRKLARTVADLEGCKHVTCHHLAEALQYRERIYAR